MIASGTALPPRPRPRLDGPERPFWQGLREGEIRVQQCSHCKRKRFPVSRYCPHCHSPEFSWEATGTQGTIESFCVFHKCYFPGFVKDMPYAVIQVRMDDADLRFYSNPIGIDDDELRSGMTMEAVFERIDDELTLLKFKPLEARR
ncbi:Zn-ribbon domain-containing OB-fold protein [Limoniibacter endophyticus]|nr:OB-fold domain-containing protein [Limoniibacter endophyticus]